jgi:hypothetical protein
MQCRPSTTDSTTFYPKYRDRSGREEEMQIRAGRQEERKAGRGEEEGKKSIALLITTLPYLKSTTSTLQLHFLNFFAFSPAFFSRQWFVLRADNTDATL